MFSRKQTYVGLLAVLLAFTVFVIVRSFSYEPQARQVPLLIAIPTLLLIVWKLGYVLRNYPPEEDIDVQTENDLNEESEHPYDFVETLRISVWPASFVLLIYLIGYYLAIPVFVFTFMRIYGKARLPIAVGSAVGVTVIVYVVFQMVLNLQLWSGIVL